LLVEPKVNSFSNAWSQLARVPMPLRPKNLRARPKCVGRAVGKAPQAKGLADQVESDLKNARDEIKKASS
jgi:hypothetical protein